MNQNSPLKNIVRGKLDITKKEFQETEPQKKLELFPNYCKEVRDFIHFQMSKPEELYIIQGKNIKIKDLKTLYYNGSWLNDEVINHYMSMIVERDSNLHAFSMIFYNFLQ